MAHYVLADVRREADRFHTMLDKIQFFANDTLYILSVGLDRAPDRIKLIQKIMDAPSMVMILGNHEHMMIENFSPGETGIGIRR